MKAIDLVITGICFICGVMMLLGKGEFLLQNKNDPTMAKRYDMDKMQRAYGVGLVAIGIVTVVNRFLLSTFIWNCISLLIVMLIFAGCVIYVRKNCKK